MSEQVALQVSDGVREVARQVGRTVVQVKAEGRGGLPGGARGLGSGIVWDQGHVITNAHVVEGAGKLKLTFADGVTRPGSVEAADSLYDLALVSTRVPFQERARFRAEAASPDGGVAEPGELAIAVGNPFGFGWTVTLGVVSAVERVLTAPGGVSLDGLIQTDAAINPGNSGGPLANLLGDVIGVTTAIWAAGQNMGFAIPSDLVRHVVGQFFRHGRAFHPWIGIAGETEVIDPKIVAAFSLPVDRGAIVVDLVEGGPADRAGLEPFDMVVAVDGRPTPTIGALRRALRRTTAGERTSLTVLRHGDLREMSLRVAEQPEPRGAGR